MKKKASNNINGNDEKSGVEVPKQKERHIVSWSQEEDDILREQIRIHGTDNWSSIASKFKDKTTRQCRRRWYTYLNSNFKKGGWSPEEDMLLCEAQKIFGNRWTEIAKVVSGRTDNAVKNRFTTLCKKRAKREALAKENYNSFINLNNKRVIFPNGLKIDGISETAAAPVKKMRTCISDVLQNHDFGGQLIGECGKTNQLLRPPLAVLAQNLQHGTGSLSIQQHVSNTNKAPTDAADNKIQGTFLKKDDPRILALMQQQELLSSLAVRVNSENSAKSLENAWQVLQDYLNQAKQSDAPKFMNSNSSFQVENFKELVNDSRSNNEGSRPYLREPSFHLSSPSSSEYSTGSTLPHLEGDRTEQGRADQRVATQQDTESEQESSLLGVQNGNGIGKPGISSAATKEKAGICPASRTIQANEGALCENSDLGFSSPIHVTPLFRSLAEAIPSPKFSESERHFLLKTLGLESTSWNQSANPSRSPPCKRSLLHSL